MRGVGHGFAEESCMKIWVLHMNNFVFIFRPFSSRPPRNGLEFFRCSEPEGNPAVCGTLYEHLLKGPYSKAGPEVDCLFGFEAI